jgi:hypothetical protein
MPPGLSRAAFFVCVDNFFAAAIAVWRKSSIFAAVNVDRFVTIATTVKNAKAVIYSSFILKSVTFGTIFN